MSIIWIEGEGGRLSGKSCTPSTRCYCQRGGDDDEGGLGKNEGDRVRGNIGTTKWLFVRNSIFFNVFSRYFFIFIQETRTNQLSMEDL